ncbi:hypothetical protein SAMN04487910_0017 [Aquimarina amphilecti]|uniref:Uncharacterized protein n=1 Tax=Aquimarina amphilecti TaxID=1038014 RepID=A0A1H7F9Q9_AQUAM|nr:hypothetical protein [Aquimarina amphilecti]SEK22861.1 hypothetical protein SAMN04487910_0017 [Aquimarina amphilecti]
MKINIIMNRLYFLFFALLLINCSEGDLIEISVDDLNGDLENCSNENDNTFVFFVIDQDINRSLSLNFTDTSFEIIPENVSEISIDEPTVITLNTTSNQFIYREFDTSINGTEYFCNSIPVSGITVTQELISSNGTAEISYMEVTSSTTETTYSRTVTLKDITLEGNGIAIRKQSLVLGLDNITIPN